MSFDKNPSTVDAHDNQSDELTPLNTLGNDEQHSPESALDHPDNKSAEQMSELSNGSDVKNDGDPSPACPACGVKLSPGAKFCTECGQKLEELPETSKNNEPLDDSKGQLSDALTGAKKLLKDKNKRKPFVVGAVVLIAALVFLLRPINVDTLSVSNPNETIFAGYDSQPLNVTYTPSNANRTQFEWSSSDENIVEVDNSGNLTAKGNGTATITVSAPGGAVSKCDVNCAVIPDFEKIVSDDCNDDSFYCSSASDNMSLVIDTNPLDIDDYSSSTAASYIKAVNKDLGLPDSIWSSMTTTTAIQGVQTKTVGIIEVSWTYHPDNGLEVMYENTSGKAPVNSDDA